MRWRIDFTTSSVNNSSLTGPTLSLLTQCREQARKQREKDPKYDLSDERDRLSIYLTNMLDNKPKNSWTLCAYPRLSRLHRKPLFNCCWHRCLFLPGYG